MHKSLINKSIHMILIILAVAIFDQLSKIYIIQNIALWNFIKATPFLNFVHTTNYGISFGMLSEENIPSLFFILIAILFCIALMIWGLRSHEKYLDVCCALIIGGAIGNIIDRITHGSVIDFIDLHLMGWHFPAFNIADSSICIGAMLILLLPLLIRENKKHI